MRIDRPSQPSTSADGQPWVGVNNVHKKMLAVVVADVEVADEYRFERLKVGTNPDRIARARRLAGRTRGRRDRDGIDRAVLATGVGGPGAVLEAGAPAA
jgi:hypothetical protein